MPSSDNQAPASKQHTTTADIGRAAVLGLLLLAIAGLAWAGADATRGKQLYQQYCISCHTSNPSQSEPVGVAYNPEGLAIAIQNQVQMNYLDGILTNQDLIDITEYIGSVVAPHSVVPQTGWYWNAAESGRGFFIEQRGNNVFMAGFHYATDGHPTWFTAQGPAAGSKVSTSMTMFSSGQTLSGPYQVPKSLPSPGSINLTFTAPSTTSMTWPGGAQSLMRFPFGGGSAPTPPQAGAPESGWWWYEQEAGRGFAIEFQGASVYVCGFMYDDAGNPIWYVTTGSMSAPNRYVGSWLQFANGQAMGGPYRAPVLVNGNVGSVILDFSDSRNGTLTLPDGRRVPLTRFVF